MSEPELVRAVGLGLRTTTGPVFTDVHGSWRDGELVAVTGPAGSGRSSLLLALTGRMRGLDGALRVAGIDALADARRVRALTSVARITGLVELEGRLTVSESITERALIDAIRPDRAERSFAAREHSLALAILRDRLVDELTAFDRAILAVGLAVLRPSRLVVLDDADAQLDLTDQRRLFEALTAMATGTGASIVVGVTETAALPVGVPRIDLGRSDPEPPDPEQSDPEQSDPEQSDPEPPVSIRTGQPHDDRSDATPPADRPASEKD